MFTLIAQNKYGEQMELTHNSAYSITEIDGIDPPDATINTTRNAGADGSVFNSAYINDRTITITLAINYPAEENRIALYQYFKAKSAVRLYYQNATRNVYIDGYVESMQIAFFEKKQTAQIVIFCPQPLFNGNNENIQEMATVDALFEFPFSIPEEGIEFSSIAVYVEKSIINNGDIETGTIITIQATGSVTNPQIYNLDTGESMILNINLVAGDVITINTRRGEKSITLLRSGTTTNIIGSLAEGSSWFQLVPGDNIFTVNADALPENMLVTFTIIDQYQGV